MPRFRFVLLASLALGCRSSALDGDPAGDAGTNGRDLPRSAAEVAWSDDVLDFGGVALGSSETRTLTLDNADGAATAEVAAQVDGDNFSVDLDTALVNPGEAVALTVTFTPTEPDAASGTLKLETNDPERPTPRIRLMGVGEGPVLVAAVAAPDPVAVGCEDAGVLSLDNAGNLDLEVDAVRIDGTEELTLDATLPLTLAPGEGVTLPLYHAPVDLGEDPAVVTVLSSDPVRPEQAIEVLVEGVGTEVVDTATRPLRPAVDLLFALDRSCSMTDDVYHFEQAVPTLLQALADHDIDYRVAVTVEDDGCILGTDLFVDASTPNAQAVVETMADRRGFAANAERQFLLLEAALGKDTPGACNEGLLRTSAALHLIAMADEPEQSPRSWEAYVADFQSLKADPDDVVVSGIGGDYPTGCTLASPYTGVWEASQATGGALHSICDDFDDTARAVAGVAAGLVPFLDLSAVPLDGTLEVSVDGVVTAAWTLDRTANRVDLDTPLDAGSTVTATYLAATACD
jgi:hypothetical protein